MEDEFEELLDICREVCETFGMDEGFLGAHIFSTVFAKRLYGELTEEYAEVLHKLSDFLERHQEG